MIMNDPKLEVLPLGLRKEYRFIILADNLQLRVEIIIISDWVFLYVDLSWTALLKIKFLSENKS